MKLFFEIIAGSWGRTNTVKEVCRKIRLQRLGQLQRRKAEREIAKLEVPKYKPAKPPQP